jgi:ATP-dependent helicase/DNAse subunit B
LVAALTQQAPEVLATLPFGDTVAKKHLEQALKCPAEVLPTHEDSSQAIDQLQSYLFLSETPPTPSAEAREEVLIVSAPGEAQESVEVARAIQAEAETGLPFDSMAVLLRSPDVYTPLLEDAFARAGIPAYFANATLRPDPAGRAFLALLDCAADQLSASRFAEYLSLGQLPELDETGGPGASAGEEAWAPPRHGLAPALSAGEPQQLDLFAVPEKVPEPEEKPAIEGTLRAPRRWERLLVDAAVIGGRDRWERRLVGLQRELEERLKEVDDPEGIDAGTIQRQSEDLTHLKRFALPLIGVLGALPTRAKWSTWLDALSQLATRALASPDGVLSILGELRPMESVGPVELFEVREVLSERLTLLSQEPPKYRYGRVWIAPIESARGMSFDVVVVPGLAERMFPKKIVEDPLLLDAQRREVSEALATQDDRIAAERLALRLAAGVARRKIIFSYPSVDLQKGRSKVPSFYLLEVARASRGELPDFETLERAAAASSGARLGWPAPREIHRAIDETELDLAFLSEALRQDTDESEARGTGRYLMAVNPALARSLRTRYLRNQPGKFLPSDGLLDPSSETRRILEGHLLSARAYSVTALEKYAACPYRFYLHALVRLRPRETVEHITHMDALTHGRIMHEAQFEISKTLEDKGLYPIRPENISGVLGVCEETFNLVSARFAEELAPAIERIWRDEIDVIRANLRGWLRREAEAPDTWTPLRREFTFGMRPHGPADPMSVPDEAVLANGTRLRGAIDAVERSTEGRVRVTDYKSGRAWVPKEAVVNGGETLQPILYALAYEALTGEPVSEARLYYCTQKGGYEQRRFVPDEEALNVVAEFKRRLDRIIADGFFPASPKPPLGCSYCDYSPICGPRAEIDAERKQKDARLSPLNWLRNLT